MTLDPDDLAAPSSLLSSRWSQDNLVTMRPGRLYDGPVLEHIEPATLEYLVQELEKSIGAVQVGAGHMGVLTWDIQCQSAGGPFVLQVPRVLDECGSRGRATRDVPRENFENLRHFRERGLTRFVAEPLELMVLGGVPAATFRPLAAHHRVAFGSGSIQLDVSEGQRAWRVALGPLATADVLAELVAALVYHYEPDRDGGTAIADVCVNDGDFALKRRDDGSFAVRLTAMRRRESGIGPSLLILYLIQMLAYEDWTVDGNLVGLPTLMSNPAITFEGLVRGLRYRARDLGHAPASADTTARSWIRDFGRSREGRGYRPWADRFLDGRLPLAFGSDLREHWWRLIPLEKKYGLLELQGRVADGASAASSARVLRSFLDRLGREIGRAADDAPGALRINDIGRDGIEAVLRDAGVPAESRTCVAEEMFRHWPYRNLDHLLGRVPEVRALRRLKSRLVFGHVVSEADQGTLRSLAPLVKEGGSSRRFANDERFLAFPQRSTLELQRTAVQMFPTFEAYMDSALHDPRWGYYARQVVIGKGGHFATNPELLSPHYGRWIAAWAFNAWRDLVENGELSESDPFPIIEFGAGNGRLARDVLDAIRERAAQGDAAEPGAWARFAARAKYHIYEMSESLREKQRQLLGDRASISVGDARAPAETLRRDFPAGVSGFVVTNEVPDAFGVHKVAISAEGRASVALVVPRVEAALRRALPVELSSRVGAADELVRNAFGFRTHGDDFYLDQSTYSATLEAVFAAPAEQREAMLSGLWFEELYVPVAAIPQLAAQLSANAADYAVALAAEESGVVLYVNVHATRFIRELGESLRAGFVVTIDYGDTTFGLVQGARRGEFPFRVYRDSADYRPRLNDPYASPGTQDMTADVNFSELARAGLDARLSVVHFGPERDVSGDELPELVRAAATQKPFAEFLGNPVFKVLVLGRRVTSAFTGPLSSSVPLSRREQDIPKARRHAIANIERALSNLGTPQNDATQRSV